MPTNIRVIHAHEFIKATPEGKIDFAKAKDMLLEIASATDSLVEYEIIIDFRNTQNELSLTDVWYLVAELGNLRKAYSRRTAIVSAPEQFDYAGFAALTAQNRGFRLSAFTSYEDAIEWLFADRA